MKLTPIPERKPVTERLSKEQLQIIRDEVEGHGRCSCEFAPCPHDGMGPGSPLRTVLAELDAVTAEAERTQAWLERFQETAARAEIDNLIAAKSTTILRTLVDAVEAHKEARRQYNDASISIGELTIAEVGLSSAMSIAKDHIKPKG